MRLEKGIAPWKTIIGQEDGASQNKKKMMNLDFCFGWLTGKQLNKFYECIRWELGKGLNNGQGGHVLSAWYLYQQQEGDTYMITANKDIE